MKVYKIRFAGKFQSVTADESTIEAYQYRGKSLIEDWKPINVYVHDPGRRKPDFYNFGVGVTVMNELARSVAATPLEMCGEILPVLLEGATEERYYAYNVTACLNVLDKEQTVWDSYLIQKYAFHADRFEEYSLFKIPDDYFMGIYALERTGDWEEDEEFKAIVDHYKLKGLSFEEIWSD